MEPLATLDLRDGCVRRPRCHIPCVKSLWPSRPASAMLGGVRMRLVRWGFRNKAMYVVSVMYRRTARNAGNRIEDLGWWDPNPAGDGNMHIGLKFDRIKYWLTAGAEPSTKVTQLLGRVGVLPEPPMQLRSFDVKPNTKWQAKSNKD